VIDIPTLFVVNIALGFAIAICVFVVAIGRYKQLFLWSLAFAIHGVSYILLSLRDSIPDFFSVILANMLIASMLALFTEGIYRFEEMKAPRLLIWWPVLGIAVLFPFFFEQLQYACGHRRDIFGVSNRAVGVEYCPRLSRKKWPGQMDHHACGNDDDGNVCVPCGNGDLWQ